MALHEWCLWQAGTVSKPLALVGSLKPRLESFNAKSDPEQIKLQRYLDDLQAALGPLPASGTGLFLRMEIAVEPQHLLHHHDVENYLTPVVRRLGARHFVFVSGTKRTDGPSRLAIGEAVPQMSLPEEREGWATFSCHAGSGTQTKAWKTAVRDKLKAAYSAPLPEGAIEAHLAWRCSSKRNWGALWKPTGDTMGPILGEPYPARPFYPNDDRITTLYLHLNTDDTMGQLVDVGMWWRPVRAE